MISTFFGIIGLLLTGFLMMRYKVTPFGMSVSQVPAGFPKQTKTFFLDSAISLTENPAFVFTAQTGMTPLSLRFTAKTLDCTDNDETYVVSMEDDGTKISTDNSAATATNTTYEATFTSGAHIAAGSVVEIVLTLGGTTPSLGGVTVEFDYLEG